MGAPRRGVQEGEAPKPLSRGSTYGVNQHTSNLLDHELRTKHKHRAISHPSPWALNLQIESKLLRGDLKPKVQDV